MDADKRRFLKDTGRLILSGFYLRLSASTCGFTFYASFAGEFIQSFLTGDLS
jgi:hypothetical protein